MGTVESYLLCGDTASLRGISDDATAEHGQPEGTGRLEHSLYMLFGFTPREQGRLKIVGITLTHALMTSTELVKLMMGSLTDSYLHTNIH